MTDNITISKARPEQKSKDYQFLREEGLKWIRQLASKTWTDHNIHDPGITILEVLCYALTEQGFRINLDIKDILASGEMPGEGPDFFTAAQILVSNPVTVNDFRKLLIDLPNIKNAWLELASEVEPAPLFDSSTNALNFATGTPISIESLYDVLLELEEDPDLGDLNSSILRLGGNAGLEVTLPGGGTDNFSVEVFFPFWDDERVEGLRADVTIDLVQLTGTPPLQQNPEDENEYYAELQIDYGGGAGSVVFGVSIKILSEVLPAHRTAVENAIIADLETAGNEGPVKFYNRKITAANNILSRVRQYLSGYRNLCEDFSRFRAVRIQEIALEGDLEVGPRADPVELLAEIFFEIDRFISPGLRFYSLDEMFDRGKKVEEIFQGPLLRSGFLKDEDLQELDGLQGRKVIYTSDLIRIIMERNQNLPAGSVQEKVPESKRIIAVRNFSISNYLNNHVITEKVVNCLNLVLNELYKPRLSISKSNVRCFRQGVELSYEMEEVLQRFESLKQEALATTENITSEDLDVPVGQQLPLADYHSIQEDFPLTYGIGTEGLPRNVPARRRAQAKQLKAYLLFYDQLLADQLAQLKATRLLFSISNTMERTYFTQFPGSVPQLDSIILPGYDNANQSLHDDPQLTGDRRSRFLDHLLSRMGEDYRTYQLLRESDDSGFNQDKEQLIQQYAFLSATRGKAMSYDLMANFRYQEDETGEFSWTWYDYTGLPLMSSPPGLGFSDLVTISEAAAEVAERASLPAAYQITGAPGSHHFELRDAADSPIGLSTQVFATIPDAQEAADDLIEIFDGAWLTDNISSFERKICHLLGIDNCIHRSLCQPLENFFTLVSEGVIPNLTFGYTLSNSVPSVILQSPNNDLEEENDAYHLINEVIANGADAANYRPTGTAPNLGFELLDPDGEVIGVNPIDFPDDPTRQDAIQEIIDLLTEEYTAEEGMHLVEHLLLRPIDETSSLLTLPLNEEGDPVGQLQDPYSFQISIVFPALAGRFRDQSFRQLVEQIIYQELPAQILPRVHWLEIREMNRFEEVFQTWLNRRTRLNTPPLQMHQAQNALVDVLNELIASS